MRYDPMLAGYHHTIVAGPNVDKSDIGVQAALDSRLQWVLKRPHWLYHEKWGDLDEHFPNTRARQFHTTIFGPIRYIPEQAIDFSTGEPKVVTTSRRDREQLGRDGHFILGNSGVRIRRFWLEHSVEQGAPAANPKLVDEFIHLVTRRRKPERAQKLADILLAQTVDPIVTPGINQIYNYTKHHEMVRPGLPNALGTLIMDEIRLPFTRERFTKKLAYLFSTLRTAAA